MVPVIGHRKLIFEFVPGEFSVLGTDDMFGELVPHGFECIHAGLGTDELFLRIVPHESPSERRTFP